MAVITLTSGCRVVTLCVMLMILAGCTGEPAPRSDTVRDRSARDATLALTTGDTAPADQRQRRESRSSRRVPCIVTAVSDGDSFRCHNIQRVRLLLLDAPEMDQQPFGVRSRDALRARMPRGDTVWLEFDVQREDRYGRTLAHAWTARDGGEHLNLVQARDGWAVAVVFPPNVRYIEAVRAAVADARRTGRGLWKDGSYTCEPVAHKQGKC